MAANLKTLVLRGILVAGDANVSPVRLGFAPAMGKPPVEPSYPVLPQRSLAGQPSGRHVEKRAAVRAGRSESEAGNRTSRKLASIARQAVQFGWPTAEERGNDLRGRMSPTLLLTASARPGAADANRLGGRCRAGRGDRSATASLIARRGA